MTTTIDAVGKSVRAFYDAQPFNVPGHPAAAAKQIRARNQVAEWYPGFTAELRDRPGAPVLEVGCGGGWFANTLAYHEGRRVLAVDACTPALDFAAGVSRRLGTHGRVRFEQVDLFTIDPATEAWREPFAVVNSLGVLHHTADCRQALHRVASVVAPGGVIHVGLYHLYGRRPFLAMFDRYRERLARADEPAERDSIEREALGVFAAMAQGQQGDTTLMRSWFRDQVLHPHETQHTVAEVVDWLAAEGLMAIGVALDGESSLDPAAAIAREPSLEAISYRRNVVDGLYYPGFFTVLAVRQM